MEYNSEIVIGYNTDVTIQENAKKRGRPRQLSDEERVKSNKLTQKKYYLANAAELNKKRCEYYETHRKRKQAGQEIDAQSEVIKKVGRPRQLTDEQRNENIKMSKKNYYLANKDKFNKNRCKYYDEHKTEENRKRLINYHKTKGKKLVTNNMVGQNII